MATGDNWGHSGPYGSGDKKCTDLGARGSGRGVLIQVEIKLATSRFSICSLFHGILISSKLKSSLYENNEVIFVSRLPAKLLNKNPRLVVSFGRGGGGVKTSTFRATPHRLLKFQCYFHGRI